MLSAHRTTWDLTVVSRDLDAHAVALAKLRADQADRLARFGEEWSVVEGPDPLTVKASLVQFVDNLDAAG